MILITVRDGIVSSVMTNRFDEEDIEIVVLNYDNVDNSGYDYPALDVAFVSAKLNDFKEDNPNTAL